MKSVEEKEMNNESELLKKLDTLIEQNKVIIQQDYYRAIHIATIKKDLRFISTLVAISLIISIFSVLVASS